MADIDDEMDMDDPARVDDEIKFNSNNIGSNGKRSAANLPVAAEDSLPWYVCQAQV